MQRNKKISEKNSVFRWIIIVAIIIVVIFQSYSLLSYYKYWSTTITNSYNEVLVVSIGKHGNQRLKSSHKTKRNKKTKGNKTPKDNYYDIVRVAVNENNNTKDTLAKEEVNITINDTVLPAKEAQRLKSRKDNVYDMINSVILSRLPFELNGLDSIFSSELQKRNISSNYEICIYNLDNNIESRTNYFSDIDNKYQSKKQEIDSTRDVVVYFENPAWLILKKMFLFLLCSVLMLVLIVSLLIYQMRIIAKQKQIEKVRQDFTDSMTHELRHPLQGALAMAEVLENPTFSESRERRTNAIKRIKYNLFNLDNLLDNIVKKAYSEKQQQKADWQEHNLKETLNDLISDFTLIANKKIKFITNFDNIKPNYQYDTVHFPNAIKNLIDNAVKYSKEDIVITLSVTNNENDFTVTVSDNGIGIRKEELSKIFDKFYQVYNKTKNHGFGLGLSYVKWVADIHSGKVNVDSEYGKGSEFSISIPFVKEK